MTINVSGLIFQERQLVPHEETLEMSGRTYPLGPTQTVDYEESELWGSHGKTTMRWEVRGDNVTVEVDRDIVHSKKGLLGPDNPHVVRARVEGYGSLTASFTPTSESPELG